MSFSGTPLGQGRRLDHSTFLGKPASDAANSLQSYAYGAPAFGSRSPPKPTSPSRERNRPHLHDSNADESEHAPALIRFARLKERETAPEYTTRPGGPKVITEPPHPEKWSVKDTSVNIATAFIQAATDMSAPNTHNGAWASSSSTTRPAPVLRSTSVEFESSAPAPTSSNRRLAPPPNKLSRPPASSTGRKPASKPPSRLAVPASDGEEDRHVRGKSPFEVGVNMAKQAIGAAAYYVRQRSHEPEDLSREDRSQELPPTNGRADGNDSSYSYTQEERSYQEAQKKAAHRKARMSEDNKAYKPSLTDDDESDELSDDGKQKRRKTKKGGIGGPLTSLPVVSSGKRRKKRRNKNAKDGADGGADASSGSEDDESLDASQSVVLRASMTRTSNPPLSHASAGRHSREPQDRSGANDSAASMFPGLDSIPEIEEYLLQAEQRPEPIRQPSQARRSRSRTPAPLSASRSPAFSIGGLLGRIVHLIIKLCLLVVSGFFSVMSMLTFLFGQVFGTSFDILLRRPVGWARGSGPVLRLLVPGLVVFAAWYALQNASIAPYVPSLSFPSRTPVYQPPAAPPANMGEFSDRLTNIESTLSGLSADHELNKRKIDDGARKYSELMGQVTHLDTRLAQEIKKSQDANIRAQNAINVAVSAIKHEMDVLQSQMAAQQKQQQAQKPHEGIMDDEARLKLKTLEERFAAVEGSSKEALDFAKKALAAPPQASSPGPSAAWWNKLASGTGSKFLQIKSADGQDVSALITHLVDNAVSRINKDDIGKADFAMQSAGARVIPSLTSPALEIKPKGFTKQVMGLFTGQGTFGFRPPITALHYDTHAGVCWPFAGEEGQLGVMLVAPVYIDEVTIDHVPKDVAFDMASAPRRMEVWGMVEGEENVRRVAEWKADRATRREAGDASVPPEEDDPAYPMTLPKTPEYIRLANFTYDIEAPNNVQTFPIDTEIRDLGVDFGIVVLRILDNWGRKEYTCLYRFRVHGQRYGGGELPMLFSGASDSR